MADPEERWRKPVKLVHTWLERLKEHYELLVRLVAEAPKDTVIVGHSLDLAVKLLEARMTASSSACLILTPVRHRRPSGPVASR